MFLRVICVVVVIFLVPLNIHSSDNHLIAALHANAPVPCIAKDIEDKSSGISRYPNGKADEQLRGVMGGLASMFLSEGSERMSPDKTDMVYTAVFYEGDPIFEVGIYAYRFTDSIDANMFEAHDGINGKFFVLNNQLLVLLWHEKLEKTERCFIALESALSGAQN